MSDVVTFERMLIGMRLEAPHESLRRAVNLATLLGADIRGIFAKEHHFDRLASLPFAREFRPLDGGWHNIEAQEIHSAADVAARNARRSFEQAVKLFQNTSEFEIVERGTFAENIASNARAGDIIVINEPGHPADRVTCQFQSMLRAAFDCPGSVLWIPAGVIQETGPIIAAATAPDDPSIRVASDIAAQAHENVRVEWLGPPESLQPTWETARGRLVVVTRRAFPDSVSTTNIWRVPILIVESSGANIRSKGR